MPLMPAMIRISIFTHQIGLDCAWKGHTFLSPPHWDSEQILNLGTMPYLV